MKPLATDTHDFPSIRRDGKIYVDKTEFIYRLIAHNDKTTVYNPISVALTLYNKDASGFSATWATTGRPSMLMNFLKREELLAIDYERMEDVSEAEFDVAELRKLRPTAMLYQSGYLTVKDYDDSGSRSTPRRAASSITRRKI